MAARDALKPARAETPPSRRLSAYAPDGNQIQVVQYNQIQIVGRPRRVGCASLSILGRRRQLSKHRARWPARAGFATDAGHATTSPRSLSA